MDLLERMLWPPLGAADQGPYITQLRKDVDAVFIGFAGIAALRFLKQFEDAGLKGKIPVLANQTAVDEALLRNMGDEALGVVSTMHYSAALDIPANRKFVTAYRSAYNADPGYYSVGAYTAGLFLKQALDKATGKVEAPTTSSKRCGRSRSPMLPEGRSASTSTATPSTTSISAASSERMAASRTS